MKKMWTAWLVAFVSTGAVLAHHSLANFDTTTAVRVKGTIVEFRQINPHSFIFLDQKGTDGQLRRWAVEGPSILQLNRKGFSKDVLKPGDVVEVCGYVPNETVMWQIANPDPGAATTLEGPPKENSMGMFIIRQCVDQVRYSRSSHGENCVHLIKVFRPDPKGGDQA